MSSNPFEGATPALIECFESNARAGYVQPVVTVDYPKVRLLHTCTVCGGPKAQGLILCWPCHRAAKATSAARGEHGDYPAIVTDLLNAVEAKL